MSPPTAAPTTLCGTYETEGTEYFGLANGIIAMSSVSIILQWIWVVMILFGLAKETAWKGWLFLLYVLCIACTNGMFVAYAVKYDIIGHWACDHTNKAVWMYVGTWISFVTMVVFLCWTWRWWALDEGDFRDNFRCSRANEQRYASSEKQRLIDPENQAILDKIAATQDSANQKMQKYLHPDTTGMGRGQPRRHGRRPSIHSMALY